MEWCYGMGCAERNGHALLTLYTRTYVHTHLTRTYIHTSHVHTYLVIFEPRETLRGEDKPVLPGTSLDEGHVDPQPALADDLVPQSLGRPLRILPFGRPIQQQQQHRVGFKWSEISLGSNSNKNSNMKTIKQHVKILKDTTDTTSTTPHYVPYEHTHTYLSNPMKSGWFVFM